MLSSTLKRAVGIAVLAGASAGAYADTTTDLGQVSTSTPTTFTGSVLGGSSSFSDIFKFTLEQPNSGSGYSVINFPLDLGSAGTLNTLFSSVALISYGADNAFGGGDDQVLKSVVLPSDGNTQDHISLTWDQPITGGAYLSVNGVVDGSLGGIYSGSISASAVSPIPEPESFAMLLAGLGLMGAVVRRRSSRNT
jgi:hypothetical protein